MACRIVSPALVTDLAACIGPVPPHIWPIAKRQIREGESWVVRDENDHPLIVGGAFPDGAGGLEAWFMPAPAAKARIVAVVRAVRLTMSDPQYRGIKAIIVSDAGRRIAALAGFRQIAAGESFEVWER